MSLKFEPNMIKLNILSVSIFLIILAGNSLTAQNTKNNNATIPPIVVVLSVDQMRTDYLSRFWNKFQEGGFKRLVNEGAVFSNAQLDLHVQKISTGTATLFTGVYPATHGIVNDSWYDRLKKKEMGRELNKKGTAGNGKRSRE